MFMAYRIQEREFSPDVIEKLVTNSSGKDRWVVFICPIGGRKNNIAHKIIKLL